MNKLERRFADSQPAEWGSFILRSEGEIDAPVAGKDVANFIPFLHFAGTSIQGNLYSVGDSRGKPEGPNIILGTRGGRYARHLTCIHFPNRRVNVKNTARVFSYREPDGRKGWGGGEEEKI